MNLFNLPVALFLPTRWMICNEQVVSHARGGLFGGQQRVIARAHCQYRRESFEGLPPRRRQQAALLASARLAPSEDALSYLTWTGDIAHFWFWTPDSGEVLSSDLNWVPESVLLASLEGDGLRVLQVAQGIEAQHWKEGVLEHSQWWSELPSLEAWQRFVRATGRDVAQNFQMPVSSKLDWTPRPWGSVPMAQRLRGLFSERMAWLTVAAILAGFTGWHASAWTRWAAANDALSVRVELARTAVAPLLVARETAETSQIELQRLQKLRPVAEDYSLMATMVTLLPEGTQLLTWKREAANLQVAVRSDETDPRAYVLAFDQDTLLNDVSVTPVANGAMQLVFSLPALGDSDDASQQQGEGIK
jgi:Tfp pilus assembly protein PilN